MLDLRFLSYLRGSELLAAQVEDKLVFLSYLRGSEQITSSSLATHSFLSYLRGSEHVNVNTEMPPLFSELPARQRT